VSSLSKTRNASIDYLRFLGALGIILFHMGMPGAWVGLSALPMFVTLIVFYGLDRPLVTHARRLLIPWAIWSGVYAVGKLAQVVFFDKPLGSEFAPWMVLTGTSLHLWFLPFAVLFFALVGGGLRALPPIGLWIFAGGASALVLWSVNTMSLPTPLPQWCASLPAAFAGAVLACNTRFAPVLLVLGGGAAALIAMGWEQETWQLLIAACALFTALALPTPSSRLAAWAGEVSFGMYLIHPLVYAVALNVLPRNSWQLYLLVVAGSILGTVLLRRILPRAV
jgi:peptidoglycan/LPS O-acetylase OafA/YrhL